MPLYASISDLAIGIAWVQSLKLVDYHAWRGNSQCARLSAGVVFRLEAKRDVDSVSIRAIRDAPAWHASNAF